MRSPQGFFALLVIMVAVSGCSRRQTFSKVWFYTYDESKEQSSRRNAAGDPVLSPANFLNLQADGKFTAYLRDFEYGSWELKGDDIVLTNDRQKIHRIAVEKIGKNELTVDVQPDNRYASSYKFEGNENNLPEEDNPFAKANNGWRIKAAHKESDEEITERLRNHFRYWEKYFGWGLKTDKQSLDVRSLQGPLKIYGNGFELVPLEDWSAEWKGYFFDAEDSRIAWNKLHYFFTYERIAWAKTDHKFKMFISAFQQLERKIE